jgi:hypothetical protein
VNGRIWAARTLLALATVLTVASIFAVWANRQVLDAGRWSDTSTALLNNEAIRTQIGDYVADQLYQNLGALGPLETALTARLQAIAGPVPGGLRALMQKAAFDLLGRPPVQAAWKTTQKRAAQHFLDIVEGNSRVVALNGNTVFVDLRPIAVDLAQQLGLPPSVLRSIPADAGRLKIVSRDQITVVRNTVGLVRGLAIILPAATLLLFALAVGLSDGRRRSAVLLAGAGLVIAGVIVLIAREVAGTQIVDSLVRTEAVRPAAHATWSITTAMLRDIAEATGVAGLVVMLAAWLGPGLIGGAQAARRPGRSR